MIFLDTMALLYYVSDSPRLPAILREEIVSTETVYVSVASIWEIGIKGNLGRFRVGWSEFSSSAALETLVATCRSEKFLVLPINADHACVAPFLPGDHKDPFDRMIVAQAVERNATLLSNDAALDMLSPALRRKWEAPTRKLPSAHERCR